MNENFPNLVVAGAPKCGTSSIYFWLAAHPNVRASREKETFFWAPNVNRFNKKCNVVKHGPEAYSRLFTHTSGAKIRFEATAAYIYYDTAWIGLSNLPEKPKVLFILREPAARTLSHYLFEMYRTKRVSMPFDEYLHVTGILDHGHYIRYLNQWVDALGFENIIILQFEQIINDPRKTMKSLAERLDIDAKFYDNYHFAVRNETVAIRSKRLHQWGLKLQSLIPHAVQDVLLPFYLKLNGAGRPSADAELKQQTAALKAEFSASNAALAARFPGAIDLALWA